MINRLEQRLQGIDQAGIRETLKDCATGLEKESLRVNDHGHIAQTPHPKALGSALTHPWITTDYAESLLELITPPFQRSVHALDFLLDIESFVYQQLDNELLWTSSMPCALGGEKDIQIAEYGHSNAGKMRHIYRQGLALRYGKMMQIIAGIHFNYSVADDFWPLYQALEQGESKPQNEQDFINAHYMGMTRNIQRFGWLVLYLFGASPAVCKTFLLGKSPLPGMEVFNQYSYYEPYGVSLRMGDIGYTNSTENDRGIKASYDSLERYTASLRHAISTPCPNYKAFGLKSPAGDYQQLNTHILQIENEYYSTVRPKQILQGLEKPVDALTRRGIRYVELRSVDINPFHPAGLTRSQLHFLETFMLFCLLQDSPLISPTEAQAIDKNQAEVAHRGRKPNLQLWHNGGTVSLQTWAQDLAEQMKPIAALLSQVHGSECYIKALNEQTALLEDAEQLPSVRILREMKEYNESFFEFARRKSEEHRDLFLERQLSVDKQAELKALVTSSIRKQADIEAADTLSFDDFLRQYFKD